MTSRTVSAGFGAEVAWLLAALVGCARGSDTDLAPRPASDAAEFPPIATSVVGKSPVFLLEQTGDRCRIFEATGATRTLGDDATCPREIADGERIRLAGRACFRESGDPTRAVPVRCPSELVDRAAATVADPEGAPRQP